MARRVMGPIMPSGVMVRRRCRARMGLVGPEFHAQSTRRLAMDWSRMSSALHLSQKRVRKMCVHSLVVMYLRSLAFFCSP